MQRISGKPVTGKPLPDYKEAKGSIGNYLEVHLVKNGEPATVTKVLVTSVKPPEEGSDIYVAEGTVDGCVGAIACYISPTYAALFLHDGEYN